MAMAGAVTSVDLRAEDHEMGRVIGRGGANIRQVMATTATKVEVLKGAGNESESMIRVMGTKEAVAKAKEMLESVGIGGARREVMVREDQVGIIIDKGGGTLREIEEETGARLVVEGRHPGVSMKVVRIYRTERQAAAAAMMVKWKIQDKDNVNDKGIYTKKDKSKDKDKELARKGRGARLVKKEFSDKRNCYMGIMERLDLLTD